MHLEVDPAVLEEVAGALRRCVDLAGDVAHHRGQLTDLVDEYGSDRLRSAADHFIGRWSYGMRLVVDDAKQLADQLQAAADTYRGLEINIGKDFR
jgi:hypothetical protein